MGVEPVEQGANLSGGQRNTMIGCTVIEAQGIPVRIHHMAAGKDHIAYIANAFIVFFSAMIISGGHWRIVLAVFNLREWEHVARIEGPAIPYR